VVVIVVALVVAVVVVIVIIVIIVIVVTVVLIAIGTGGMRPETKVAHLRACCSAWLNPEYPEREAGGVATLVQVDRAQGTFVVDVLAFGEKPERLPPLARAYYPAWRVSDSPDLGGNRRTLGGAGGRHGERHDHRRIVCSRYETRGRR